MKINRVKCDQCGCEQEALEVWPATNVRKGMLQLTLPPANPMAKTATGIARECSFDFCSEMCVGEFIKSRSSLHNDKLSCEASKSQNQPKGNNE